MSKKDLSDSFPMRRDNLENAVLEQARKNRIAKKNRKKPPRSGQPPCEPPRWIPPGFKWNDLPRELQAALIDVVEPAYAQLVAGAADNLEKSTALSVVLLLWQEIINQYQLGEEYVSDAFLRLLGNYGNTLSNQLQLVDAKTKASYILVRLREGKRLPGRAHPVLNLPAPTPMIEQQTLNPEP